MEFIACGTPVLTTIGQIKCLITGVCIRDTSLSYEISWFANGLHQTHWVRSYEIELDDHEKGTPGLLKSTLPTIVPVEKYAH